MKVVPTMPYSPIVRYQINTFGAATFVRCLKGSQVTHRIPLCSSILHKSYVHRAVALGTIWSRVSSTCIDESWKPPSHAIGVERSFAALSVVIDDLVTDGEIAAAKIALTDVL